MHIDLHLNTKNDYKNYSYYQSSNYYSNGWNRKPSRSEVSDFINELMNEAKKSAKIFDKEMIFSVLSDLESKNIEVGFNINSQNTSDFNRVFLII